MRATTAGYRTEGSHQSYGWQGLFTAKWKATGNHHFIIPHSIMDMEKESITCRLGRRPVEQGPRLLSSNQGRGDKLAIGRKSTEISNIQDKKTIQLRKQMRLGTWNVRSLLQMGKVHMMEQEMLKMKVNLCGLAEVRWEGQGHFTTSNGNTIVYSGGEKQGQRGVAIWIQKEVADCIMGYETVNDRIMTIRLKAKPQNITITQIYSPTALADEDEITTFYEEIHHVLQKTPKKDYLVVMGDFNAKVGKNYGKEKTTGRYGLGERNEAGVRLVNFCEEKELTVINTHFKKHPRKIYTWISPDRAHRNQIDYIIAPQKWKNHFLDCTTYPGADCDTDHQLLVATMKIKLKRQQRAFITRRLNVDELKGEKLVEYAAEVNNRFEALNELQEEKTPESLWQELKTILMETAENTVGYIKNKRSKEWVTEETKKLIIAKRELKNKDADQYKQLKGEVQRKLRQDKVKQLEETCEEIEEAQKKGNMRKFFQITRSITRKFNPNYNGILSSENELLTETDKIAERWREYCEELYDETDSTTNTKDILHDTPREPPPLRSEVVRAMKDTANKKAPGPDGIPIELLKEGGEAVINRMHKICTALWESGEWPEEWTYSYFLPLPKKGDRRNCDNYRTIALVSHASKIILRIILERIRTKTESELAIEQAGFRKGRGTRDQITNLRILLEKANEQQLPVYMCFVDFKKAFDSVRHEELWISMIEMGYPPHLIELLTKMYNKQKAKVKVAGTLSNWLKIKKGVRQGCVISPYLFNIMAEKVMREALDGYLGGIRIGGKMLSNLRYADDIILIGASTAELQDLVSRVDIVGRKYNMMINIAKTKVMALKDNNCNIKIQNVILEQVTTFPYLGSIISDDTSSKAEIRNRLNKGRMAGASLNKIWKSHSIPVSTKVRLLRSLVWPVATYGCESWTIMKEDEQRIQAFEMKGLRQIMRVSWTAKKTNEWVLDKAGVQRTLLETVKKRKLKYWGHIVRTKQECLEKEIIQGTMPGSRKRGRPRKKWEDNIKEWTGLTIEQATRKAEDRSTWKKTVHNAANLRSEDG